MHEISSFKFAYVTFCTAAAFTSGGKTLIHEDETIPLPDLILLLQWRLPSGPTLGFWYCHRNCVTTASVSINNTGVVAMLVMICVLLHGLVQSVDSERVRVHGQR